MAGNIFNFQTYNCFDLQACDHQTFIQPLSSFTQITRNIQTNNVELTFLHQPDQANQAQKGGFILQLSTYPGESYHLCGKGMLSLGDKVSLLVKSGTPEFNLMSPISWELGNDDSYIHIVFKAIHVRTIVLFYTDFLTGLPNHPYEFSLSSLQIIPSGLSCPGVFQLTGSKGPRGPLGPKGETGPPDMNQLGPQGPVGEIGEPGFSGGNIGPVGPVGIEQGPVGPDGLIGPQIVGPVGNLGVNGSLGPQGPQGPMGNTGNRGVDGLPGLDKMTIESGQELLTWTGAGFELVSNIISFNRQENLVTLFFPTFTWNQNMSFESYKLQTNDLSIIPPLSEISYFPVIISVNGQVKTASLKLSGSQLTLSNGVNEEDFPKCIPITFLTQSISYLI